MLVRLVKTVVTLSKAKNSLKFCGMMSFQFQSGKSSFQLKSPIKVLKLNLDFIKPQAFENEDTIADLIMSKLSIAFSLIAVKSKIFSYPFTYSHYLLNCTLFDVLPQFGHPFPVTIPQHAYSGFHFTNLFTDK